MTHATDDFRLAVGCFMTSIGALITLDASGLYEVGDLWYPLPDGWSLLAWQEHPAFGVLVLLVGLAYLATYLGWVPTLALRASLSWIGTMLMVNLLLHRLVGFFGPTNPPWWATLSIGALTLVLTLRRVRDLRLGTWHG